MDTFADDLKRGISQKIEANTGFIGQVMRQRREEAEEAKRTKAELSEIEKATQKMRSIDKSYKKIHSRLDKTKTNFSIMFALLRIEEKRIAKLHGKPIKKFEKAKQAIAHQRAEEVVSKDNETLPLFDKLVDLLDALKGKLPKRIPTGKGPKRGGRGLMNIARAIIRSPVTAVVAKGTTAIALATHTTGLNKGEEEELAKKRQQPATITPTAPPPSPSATVTTPSTPIAVPPPLPLQPTAPPSAPAAPAIQPAPPPTPPITPVVKPSAASQTPVVPKDLIPQEPQATGAQPLSTTVKLADPGVSLAGLNGAFEKRVAAMATEFKQKSGKTLTVTSGVRTNEKQKELYDAKVAALGGNETAAKKLVAEPMAPLGKGRGSMHLKGLALDVNSKGDAGINALAGNRAAPTGWLEKFGLTRPVPNEDWHIQPSGSVPAGDNGMVPGKDGKPVDPSTGKALPVPSDPSTGKTLLDTSKSVDQLKKEQNAPGQTTIIMKNTTTNVTKVRGRDSN